MVEECGERCSESSVQFSLVGDVLIECCSESSNRIAGRYLFAFDEDLCGVVGGRGSGSRSSCLAGGGGHRRNIELPENLDRYSNVEAAVQQLLGG